jgi:hypothetical protein
MRAFLLRRFWMALPYRLSVLGVCLAYLFAALEIPLPVLLYKDSSQPFPCQDHPCGCLTAEQCWSQCCCFTPEERGAWARVHNVEPPAYAEKPVEKPAARGWNTAKLRDRDNGPTAKSCCRACQPAAPASDALANCCRTCEPAAPEKDAIANTSGWRMTAMAAWRCQGYSTLWVSTGAALPLVPLAAWSPDDAPPVRISLSSELADKLPFPPLDPPPRLSLV